jgi:hypothetical protein
MVVMVVMPSPRVCAGGGVRWGGGGRSGGPSSDGMVTMQARAASGTTYTTPPLLELKVGAGWPLLRTARAPLPHHAQVAAPRCSRHTVGPRLVHVPRLSYPTPTTTTLHHAPQVKLRRVEADGSLGATLSSASAALPRDATAPSSAPHPLTLDTVDTLGCVSGVLRASVTSVSLLALSRDALTGQAAQDRCGACWGARLLFAAAIVASVDVAASERRVVGSCATSSASAAAASLAVVGRWLHYARFWRYSLCPCCFRPAPRPLWVGERACL